MNNSVFARGDVVSLFNNSGGNLTLTAGASVTLYYAGTATTGNRTIAQRGLATIIIVDVSGGVTYAAVSGAGIT